MDNTILQVSDYLFVTAMAIEIMIKLLAEGLIITPKVELTIIYRYVNNNVQYQSVSVKGNSFNYFTNMVSNDHLLFELGSAKGHEWHLGHVHLHSELHLFGVDARDSKTKLSCTHSNDAEML